MQHIPAPPKETDFEALDKKLDELLEQEIWDIERVPKDLIYREHLERWAKTHPGTDLWAIANFLSDLEVWTRQGLEGTHSHKGEWVIMTGTSSYCKNLEVQNRTRRKRFIKRIIKVILRKR